METQDHILVVDDDLEIRSLLGDYLRRNGYRATVVPDGRAMWQTLDSAQVDLVILDVMLPGEDGFSLCRQLGVRRGLPVIMLTAKGEDTDRIVGLELGADDYLPKPFNPVVLRARVNASLDKKKLHDRERMWAESMERELEIGRRIQAGFFPNRLPSPAGWELAAHFEPARQVAGDFYDAFPLDDGTFVVVADVCDKGVGAALYMALFRSLIRAIATEQRQESHAALLLRTASRTNDYIATIHGDANMFATAFLAVLDGSGAVHYVNAGHEAPMIVRDAGIERLAPTGPALGLMPDVPFTADVRALAAGDLLLAFTDGVTEAKGADGFFGLERLETLVGDRIAAVPAIERVMLAIKEFEQGERADDITMLAVRRV